jgi:hypothetical protein
MTNETNRAKWDQEKSYIVQARDEAITDYKAIQRKYEQLVKDHERLKEANKREKPSWKGLGSRAPNLALGGANQSNNLQAGIATLNKLNLGGPGNGMNQGLGGMGGGVMQSMNFGGPNEGGLSNIASSARVDKSMDNLNLGALKSGG